METEEQVKRRRLPVAVLAGAAVLVAGAAGVFASGVLDGAPPVPGPVGRAAAAVEAVGAGVPASPSDLTALIGDRETWLREHPGDDRSWAVLGSAYLERGRWTADPADFPRAEMALRTRCPYGRERIRTPWSVSRRSPTHAATTAPRRSGARRSASGRRNGGRRTRP